MAKKSRSLDLRRIRLSVCYTMPEVAKLLGVTIGTVWAWVRAGLPILEDVRPFLIPGDDLKTWLRNRARARKQACQPNELYCFRCRAPREPEPGTVRIILRNQKVTSIKGCCSGCGCTMNRAGSAAKIYETMRAFGVPTMG